MERKYFKIIENVKLPDILNLINTGNVTDSETNDVNIENLVITNGDVIIKPVLNTVTDDILKCFNFGIDTGILSEEPEEFETECLQYTVFKYDKSEKTLITMDLWEFLNINNFINENFEYIIDLDSNETQTNDKNIALINNWILYGWT